MQDMCWRNAKGFLNAWVPARMDFEWRQKSVTNIQLECPAAALFVLFDSSTVSDGLTREAPGGAILRLCEMPMEKRHLPGAETFVTIAVTLGSGIGINLFSNWLYEKLKGHKRVKTLRINRVQVEISADAIRKVISESIETEDRS